MTKSQPWTKTRYQVFQETLENFGFKLISQNPEEMYFDFSIKSNDWTLRIELYIMETPRTTQRPYSGSMEYYYYRRGNETVESRKSPEFCDLTQLRQCLRSAHIDFLNFTYSKKSNMEETKQIVEIKTSRFLDFRYENGGLFAFIKVGDTPTLNANLSQFLNEYLPADFGKITTPLIKSLSILFTTDIAKKEFDGFLNYQGDRSNLVATLIFPFTTSKSKALTQIEKADRFFNNILKEATAAAKNPDAITTDFVAELNGKINLGSLTGLKTTELNNGSNFSLEDKEILI